MIVWALFTSKQTGKVYKRYYPNATINVTPELLEYIEKGCIFIRPIKPDGSTVIVTNEEIRKSFEVIEDGSTEYQ